MLAYPMASSSCVGCSSYLQHQGSPSRPGLTTDAQTPALACSGLLQVKTLLRWWDGTAGRMQGGNTAGRKLTSLLRSFSGR